MMIPSGNFGSMQTFTNPDLPGQTFVRNPDGSWGTLQLAPRPGTTMAKGIIKPDIQGIANTNPVNFAPPPPPPEVTAPFQQSPLAPSPVPSVSGAGAGLPGTIPAAPPIQNPIPPELAPPVFNVVPPAPDPVPSPVPPALAPPPAAVLPPVTPPPQPQPSVNLAPPPPPPPPPEAPITAFANPIQNLQNLQAQSSPLAPPQAAPAPPVGMPDIPPPMPGMQNMPITAPSITTLPGTGGAPVAPQTIGESIASVAQDITPPVQTGDAVGNTGIPGTTTGTGMQGLAPAAGGPSSTEFSPLAPPTDEGPKSIQFKPNIPRPVAPSLIGNDVEGFLGDLSQMQFGPGGILGAPGGQRRAQGQTEADFLKQLLSQGLFGVGL